MDLKELDILGPEVERHWYYSSKAEAVKRLLGAVAPTRILDVGSGSGFFPRYLLAHTEAAEAWCVDTRYDADAEAIEAGKPVHFRRSVPSLDVDLVLMMDVLEHLDDDAALLKEVAAKVPRESRFLISVPAFRSLWSGHDDFLEHRRRYTLAELEAIVRGAGLRVRLGTYYFGLVLPIAAILRWAQRAGLQARPARSQLIRHDPVVNAILKGLCRAELPFLRLNRAAGLTAFCLAEKP